MSRQEKPKCQDKKNTAIVPLTVKHKLADYITYYLCELLTEGNSHINTTLNHLKTKNIFTII